MDKVLGRLGVESLSQMQLDTSDAVLHTDRDIVVLSPTGSGKTLAYLLPLVERIDPAQEGVQAIVLVPGRELALQSAGVLKDLGSGLRTMALYGGRPTMDEHRRIREVKPQIVFATPGRLNDHLTKENFPVNDVQWLVIDEFDKCLAMGFRDEMSEVVSKLPQDIRHILLSATDAEEIPQFVNLGKTKRINYIDETGQISSRVNIYKVKSPDKDKLETVSKLLRHIGEKSSVVFLNYRESVERAADYLRQQGFAISMFHGGLDQKMREDALYKFSNGSANVLVCTDLASRGLDVLPSRCVIHGDDFSAAIVINELDRGTSMLDAIVACRRDTVPIVQLPIEGRPRTVQHPVHDTGSLSDIAPESLIHRTRRIVIQGMCFLDEILKALSGDVFQTSLFRRNCINQGNHLGADFRGKFLHSLVGYIVNKPSYVIVDRVEDLLLQGVQFFCIKVELMAAMGASNDIAAIEGFEQ